jgi:Bifunctional DNA primase/polymerase, N-terminal
LAREPGKKAFHMMVVLERDTARNKIGIFASWQPRYAERGIATFPVTADKAPATKGYLRTGLRGSAELAQKFQHADALGFACGPSSGITLVDVDTKDEKVLATALATYGETPVISRTASGGFHAWYRNNGERRRQIKPIPDIDILGGGMAVAPPSRVAKGNYEFIHGSLDDLDRLKPMPGGIISTNAPAPKPKASLRGMREHDGRNNALFLAIGPIARTIHQACGTRDQLLDAARKHNAQCAEPMEDKEVSQIVDSVWNMTREGRNVIGLPGAFCLTLDHLEIEDMAAFKLLAFLRAHQGPHATFWCTNSLAERFGLDRERFAKARRDLIERGYLVPLKQAGKGHPAVYRWGIY